MQVSCKNRQNTPKFILSFSAVLLLLCICVLALAMTTAKLSGMKTATGNITFNLESPAISLDSGLKFYYANNEMTYGSTTEQGVSLNNVPYKLSIDSDNLLSGYYVRVALKFTDESGNNLSDISFSNFSVKFSDNTTMSAPVYNAELSGYSSTSSAKVSRGSEINLMDYLKSIVPNDKSFDLSVVITADKSADFNSVNRSQTTIKASVGVFYTAFTLGSGFDNFSFSIEYWSSTYTYSPHYSCNLSTQENLTFQYKSENSYYLKLEIPVGNTILETGAEIYRYKSSNQDDFSNQTGVLKYWTSDYSYTLTNDANESTTITLEFKNKITTETIDISTLLINFAPIFVSGDNSYSMSFTNEKQIINFYCSDDGSNYNSLGFTYIKLIKTPYTCITGDTQIKTENGYILVKDLKIGDIILSLNERTGEIENTTVTRVLETQNSVIYTINFDDGTYLNITGSHPMLTERGWVCAESTFGNSHNVTIESVVLKLGDKVKTESGWKKVVSITQKYNSETLYNISVDNNHNYFANGVLLHNKIAV